MKIVKLDLSDSQLAKMRKQQPVQIKPSQVGGGVSIHLTDANYNKLAEAYKAGKSTRITLSGHESQLSGGSLKSFARGVKKTFKDPNLGRKISNTSRKIKNTYNQFEVVGDLGIPYVSDAYNLGHVAVNNADALTQAGVEMNNARLYGNENDQEAAKNNFISTFGKAQTSMQGMSGGSIPTKSRMPPGRPRHNVDNPYVPRSMRGGSFKGGSFKVQGGAMRPSSDESNFVGPSHPSFNPVKPDSYSGNGMKHRCQHCGK
jgi:hypothetical protein